MPKNQLRLLYYIAVLLFVIAHIPNLNQAFYWDESWVYAPAISHMYDHGPSLMPDAIPVLYSRGHPILYHAVCAAWMKLFGTSHIAMHSFALSISVLLCITVFDVVTRIFNAATGAIAGLLLLCNILFFVAAPQLLTDVPLALLVMLSIYYYSLERYIPAIVSLSLLYLIKESSWVMVVIPAIDTLQGRFTKRDNRSTSVRKLATTVLPLLPIALYFLIQKSIFGWFFFPNHIDCIHLDTPHTLQQFQTILNYLFVAEHQYMIFALIAIVAIGAGIKYKSKNWLLLLLGLIATYLNTLLFDYKDGIFYAYAVACIVALFILLFKGIPGLTALQNRFLKISVSFGLLFIYFTAINFFEPRYLTPAFIIFTCLLPAIILGTCIRIPQYISLPAILIIAFFSYRYTDCINTFYGRLHIHQALVNYLEEKNYYTQYIYCNGYIQREHLTNYRTGVLSSTRSFTHIQEFPNDSTQFAVVDNIEYEGEVETIRNNPHFRLIQRFSENNCWIEVYERK